MRNTFWLSVRNDILSITLSKFRFFGVNKLKKVLLAIAALALSFFAACKPFKAKIYTVGDTCFLTDNDGATEICAVCLDSAEYSKNEGGDTCNLALTYSIFPETEIQLDSRKIFVSCGDEKFYTDKHKNSDKNGIDIFNSSIDKEIKYTFYFDVPNSPYFENLENRGEGNVGWALTCHFEDAEFKVYTGELFDGLNKPST